MKRVFLFLVTNLAVMLVLSVVVNVLGLNRWLDANGLNVGQLLAFSLVIGFGGAFISLLMSKVIAKWSTGTQIINPQQPRNRQEAWLVQTVSQLAQRASIGTPEVGIYEGPPNAFATGASRNSALVAVSTGLLESMTEEEVTAVLGHEVAHVANGDMVTLTLIQGVVNTFVVFFARIVGYLVDKTFFRREGDNGGMGMGAMMTTFVCEILFGILASMIVAWFSRQREYRADAGAAQYLGGRQPMIRALQRLGGLDSGDLPKAINALGINGAGSSIAALFSTHPPIESRIKALQNNPIA